MPSQVVATPSAQARTIAARTAPRQAQRGGGGPISSAVERMDPMAIDESPTATASASMNSKPMMRDRMPATAAISGLAELSSSGR